MLSVLPASAATLGAAQVVPGTTVLTGVSCSSAATCVAVGQNVLGEAVVVSITNGVPGAARVVPGVVRLNGVSCPDATCQAVGQAGSGGNLQGVVVPITNGTPGAPQMVPGTYELNGVSCFSATTCVAVGQNGGLRRVVVPITDGTPGAAQAFGPTELTGVSCSSATTCVAVGDLVDYQGIRLDDDLFLGVVVRVTNGIPGGDQSLPRIYPIYAVSCSSANTCVALGGYRMAGSSGTAVVPITDGIPGAPQVVPGPVGLAGVSCSTATTCQAVGGGASNQGVVVPITNGAPGAPQVVPGTSGLRGVSCFGTSCVAVGQNASNQGVVVTFTGRAQPRLSTSASANVLVGAPVFDTATLSGGSSPTGTFTFTLYGPDDATCAGTPVGTSVVPVGGAGSATSGYFTPRAAGTYRFMATYSGDANNDPSGAPCNAPGESVVIAPLAPPTFTRTITGDLLGPVTVDAGDSILITNGRVDGPVTVKPGGALTVVNSQISGGIVADNPSFLSICGASVSGPSPNQALAVSNATVPIRIGDPASGCAGNRFAAEVSLRSNLAVTFGANLVSNNVNVDRNGPGNTVLEANIITQALNCAGNSPLPTNAGQANTARAKSGQCIGI